MLLKTIAQEGAVNRQEAFKREKHLFSQNLYKINMHLVNISPQSQNKQQAQVHPLICPGYLDPCHYSKAQLQCQNPYVELDFEQDAHTNKKLNKVNGFALFHFLLVFLNNCHARHLLEMMCLQERGIQYKLTSGSRWWGDVYQIIYSNTFFKQRLTSLG